MTALTRRLKWAFNPLDNLRDIYVRPNERFAMIDGIRGLSLLYIFLFHSMLTMELLFGTVFENFIHDTPIELQWILMGDLSVDAFFVISGFLIAQLLFREHQKNGVINLKRFYVRRWLRLTPAYYSAILLYLAIMPEFQPKYALAYAFYLNNFLDNQHNYMAFAWSLAVEEQFYIVFSLFLVLFFYRIKHKLLILSGLFFLSFIIRAMLLVSNPELLLNADILLLEQHGIGDKYWEVIYDNFYTRYGALIIGVILGYLFVYQRDRLSRFMTATRSNALLFVALILLVILWRTPLYNGEATEHWLLYIFHVFYRNIFSVCIALLVLVCLFPYGCGRILNSFLSLRLLFPFSQLSYSAYLLHMPIIIGVALLLKSSGAIRQAEWANVWLVFGCSIVPIFFFSALAFIMIERPFMKLRNEA